MKWFPSSILALAFLAGALPAISDGTGGAPGLQIFSVFSDKDRPPDPRLLAAKEIGATVVRPTPNLIWFNLEPVLGGGYLWDRHDEVIRRVQSMGFEYEACVFPDRPDDPGKPAAATDPHARFLVSAELRPAYQAFVRALVRRYCRIAADGNPDAAPGLLRPIHLWSFTAELPLGWVSDDPRTLIDDMAAMFRLFYDAVHDVDRQATVVLPLDSNWPYLAAFADGYCVGRDTIVYKTRTITRLEANSGRYLFSVDRVKSLLADVLPDAYDIHLYGDTQSIPDRKRWLNDYVSARWHQTRPVCSMEGGEPFGSSGEVFPQGPTCEDPARLAYESGAMARHFTLAFESGYSAVTYNLWGSYAPFGAWFGDMDLLDARNRPRPAYYTYKLAVSKLTPFSTAAPLAVRGTVSLHRFTFGASKGNVWVAWDEGLQGNQVAAHDLSALLPFPRAQVTHAVTVAGETTPVVTVEPARAIVFGQVPVFLEAAAERR